MRSLCLLALRSNSGTGRAQIPPKACSKNEAGSSKPPRRARLLDLVGFAVPSPEITSHSRRGCFFTKTRPLRLGLFLRRWSGRLLLGCFTATPAEQRQGILGTEGEAADRLLTSGAQSDIHPPVVGHAHRHQAFPDLPPFRPAES